MLNLTIILRIIFKSSCNLVDVDFNNRVLHSLDLNALCLNSPAHK